MPGGETKQEMPPPAFAPQSQNDPHATEMQRLAKAVLAGPGMLDLEVRQAAADAGELPEALRAYLDKVARHAYKVTDEDVIGLREAGYSEDQIFEATVSCALGACLRRLEAGLTAIERGP
jgi:alkylhydroperoxidase family enzyme